MIVFWIKQCGIWNLKKNSARERVGEGDLLEKHFLMEKNLRDKC